MALITNGGLRRLPGGANDGIIAGPDASGVDPVSSSGNYSWSWFGGYDSNVYYGDNTGNADVRVKSEYDPCPAGYRVPSHTEWVGLINYASGTWISANSTAGQKYGDALYLPVAGYRNNDSAGMLESRNSLGYYWSTRKYSSDGAYGLGLYNGGAFGNYANQLSFGFSVRCIAQ
jgi:uncharacterized protein (TIGR02145 family)